MLVEGNGTEVKHEDVCLSVQHNLWSEPPPPMKRLGSEVAPFNESIGMIKLILVYHCVCGALKTRRHGSSQAA